MSDQSITSLRRYYLAKRQTSAMLGETALELVWRGKQEAETGTALPDDFPQREKLASAGYIAVEDLNGADECELRDEAKLQPRDAQLVLTALQDLIP